MRFSTVTRERSSIADERSAMSRRRAIGLFLLDNGVLLALVVEIVVFSLASPDVFFTSGNLINILRFASLGGILVACYTCAMLAGQLDLSTPQVGGFAAVIFAVLFQIAQWPLLAALAVALVAAVVIGLLNSWLISRLGIPSLVATLAVGTLCLGIAYVIVDALGQSGAIRITRPPLRSVVSTELLGIPVTVYIMFVVYLVLYVLMNHTKLGAHLYAIGGNAQAAQLNGIQITRLIRLVMVLTAVSAGFTSIFLSGRQLAAGPFISALGASSSGSLAAPA